MKLIKLEKIKNLFSKINISVVVDTQLETIADKIVNEIDDVIQVFKSSDKKWSWNPFKAYKIYEPVIKEIIEVVKVVGDQLKLSGSQKKNLAEILCWKVISPMLPKFVRITFGKIIKFGISMGIEKIYSWLKDTVIPSEVFSVGNVR